MRRTLQEGPKLCCGLAVIPRKPRVPTTHLARGEFWSCHGSGRFGDTTLWGTRGARGARGWDASAIPPRVGLRLPLFDVFIALFFPQLSSAGEIRVQTWMFGVVPRAHEKVACHLFHRPCHHTACSTTPMQYATQLLCNFQHSQRTFVTFFFTFCKAVHQPGGVHKSTFPQNLYPFSDL